jgi:zinc finger protein
LTKIPHFHDVILMSFSCKHCGYENVDVQSAEQIRDKGVRYSLSVAKFEDLDRAIMVSDTARVSVKEFEIEKQPSSGQLTSVEGVLAKMSKDLYQGQAVRKLDDPGAFRKINRLVWNLLSLAKGEYPATLILDDPAGNAWLERLPTDTRKNFRRELYVRTLEQNREIGIGITEPGSDDATPETNPNENLAGFKGLSLSQDNLLYSLQILCPGCTKPAALNHHIMDIPHFKQVVISAANCDHCGYRTNDVKTGGEIPEKGQRIWLEVKEQVDLHRDILKSETCAMRVPECELEVVPGSMGGRFTTVEGLLTQVRGDLHKAVFNFGEDDEEPADSLPQEKKDVWGNFFRRLDKAINGEMKYTIILEDPFASSYVQSLCSPDADPQIRVEDYERTEEEEQEFGLADMKTHLGPDGVYVKEILDTAGKNLVSEVVKEDAGELKGEAPEAAGKAKIAEPDAAESKGTESKAAEEIKKEEPKGSGEVDGIEPEAAGEFKGKFSEAKGEPTEEDVSLAMQSYEAGTRSTGKLNDAPVKPPDYLSRWLAGVKKVASDDDP